MMEDHDEHQQISNQLLEYLPILNQQRARCELDAEAKRAQEELQHSHLASSSKVECAP
jgi:hypothetical protein